MAFDSSWERQRRDFQNHVAFCRFVGDHSRAGPTRRLGEQHTLDLTGGKKKTKTTTTTTKKTRNVVLAQLKRNIQLYPLEQS